ncbi:MAG: hypothetical protein RXQ77_03245 [Candidatus Nanopusillus sp.]
MNDQQSYKSSTKIYDLIQEEINKRLKYPIQQLEKLLNEMYEKAQEKANLSEIEGSFIAIDLYINKDGNEPIQPEYSIGTYIHGKGNSIGCNSNSQDLLYKIECLNYKALRVFRLFDLPQSISFIEGIKNSILNICNISNPEVLTHMDKQYMHINTTIFMYLNKIKENPKISISNNEFRYYDGRLDIYITCDSYDPKKQIFLNNYFTR